MTETIPAPAADNRSARWPYCPSIVCKCPECSAEADAYFAKPSRAPSLPPHVDVRDLADRPGRRPGRIGVETVAPRGSRKLPRYVASLMAARHGFPTPFNLGTFKVREDAALAVDRARIVIGLPPINFPGHTHEDDALAETRALIAQRRPN